MANIAMLGTGLIGSFYTSTLLRKRGRDKVGVAYSRTENKAQAFAEKWGISAWATDMAEAINRPDVDVVVIGLPNYLHLEAVRLAAAAGKAVLCTKPLGRNAAEALEMLKLWSQPGFSRLPGRPGLHAQDAQGTASSQERCARQGVMDTLRARRIPGHTVTGSGRRSSPVAVPSSIWAATVSRSDAISSARMCGRWR